MPAEWAALAPLFDAINESFIGYDEQAAFLLQCRDRFMPHARNALDLGCATGQHARRLEAAGLGTTGVDLSPRLLRAGRKSTGGARLVCADLTALPLKGRFDLIYALNFVVSFLHSNEALLGALREVRRALSPRGVFVMDYHYYFPLEEGLALATPWREECRLGRLKLTVTHRPTVNWGSQLCTDEMVYRFREGRRVVREVRSTEVRRISLPQDLAAILEASGLALVTHCGRFDLDAPPQETGVFVARRGVG
jgi:SAM-dependent methyltransferase